MRIGFERRALHLFDRLLNQPEETRETWLKAAAGGDMALVRAVEALAAADRQAASLPTMPPDAATPAEPPPPPARLGNYRLARELGRGGMGVVYLGERDDGLFEQQVAVKLLRQHVAGRAAAAFEAERRLLARIEHPNVARLIDGGVAADGRPWLAIEHVQGDAIDAAAAALPLAGRVRLFLQAAHAVQFAHGRLIAHGDVKPANLLVDGHGRVKLLDFGVARLTAGEALDRAGAFTPGYASPERLAGGQPSVADDVYALGRTLAAVAGAARDREVEAAIGRATAPGAARYPTVQALIDDLDRWLAGRPVAAMNGGVPYAARKFVRRHRMGVAATSLALLALGGAGFVAQRNARHAEQARAAAALRFADAHRTAHYLMFTLLDRLERQPGTLRLRAQVGTVAQVYLDRLAASPDAPRDVRLDVARGYLRAATTAAMSNGPNLGDVNRATRDLDAATRMLDKLQREEPHWPALAEPRSREYSLRCQNHIYGGPHDAGRALAVARNGIAALASLATDAPTRAAARWVVRICEGDALVWLNRTPEAIRLLERELAAGRARRSADPAMLERNLRILGEAYYYANRLPDAERVLNEAARAQAAINARQPYYGPGVNEMANVADDLASTYELQHRPADQLRVADAALRLVEAQAALDADDLEGRRRALSMVRLVASAKSRLGRHAQAVARMIGANRGWDAIHRRFPNDATTARLRLMALGVTASLQSRAGQAEAGCRSGAAALAGWTAFGRQWRLSPSDVTENLLPLRRQAAACRASPIGPGR